MKRFSIGGMGLEAKSRDLIIGNINPSNPVNTYISAAGSFYFRPDGTSYYNHP